MCPPVSLCKGTFVVHPSRMMRVFLVWKRRCADIRAGTQAPPLRVSFGWIVHGQAYWSLFTQKRDVS